MNVLIKYLPYGAFERRIVVEESVGYLNYYLGIPFYYERKEMVLLAMQKPWMIGYNSVKLFISWKYIPCRAWEYPLFWLWKTRPMKTSLRFPLEAPSKLSLKWWFGWGCQTLSEEIVVLLVVDSSWNLGTLRFHQERNSRFDGGAWRYLSSHRDRFSSMWLWKRFQMLSGFLCLLLNILWFLSFHISQDKRLGEMV